MKFITKICVLFSMICLFNIASFANTIFIGDSRTVGIYDAIHGTSTANKTNVCAVDLDGTVWSCKVSMGLKWMKEVGVPQIENLITEGSNVVILMGVNDVSYDQNVLKYLEYINTKGKEWTDRGAKVYYAGIMPIKKDDKYATNAQINNWNTIMAANLQNAEYISMDGISQYNFSDTYHFKRNTSLEIFSYLNEYVNKPIMQILQIPEKIEVMGVELIEPAKDTKAV